MLLKLYNASKATYKIGLQKVTSTGSRHLASRYLGLAFSPKTWDVGLDYFRAAIRGDFTKFKRLNASSSVQQVGGAFNKLARSNLVHTVGHGFQNYGTSVFNTFKKV